MRRDSEKPYYLRIRLERMKKLAISIPNYDRIDSLRELLLKIVAEIRKGNLFNSVQICVSDDGSRQDPTAIVTNVIQNNADIDILYHRKKKNQGMSRNFLDSALMGDAEFCWIIGNDDILEDNSLAFLIEYLNTNPQMDFLVTPFDVYQNGIYSNTIFPLNDNHNRTYDTSYPEQQVSLFDDIIHNSGVFGFLSNVIFRRQIWVDRKSQFEAKMATLFIQMYINLSFLFEGARYDYVNTKIIRNNADPYTNNSIERIAGVLFGLDEIVEYFFKDSSKTHMKTILTDPFINGKLWDEDDESIYKASIKKINSPKNELYKKYFIPSNQREALFTRKVIIFGCGDYGRMVYEEALKYGAEIVAVLDSNLEKCGHKFGNHYIAAIGEICSFYKEKETVVIVANHHQLVEMVETVLSYGADNIAIIT